MGCCLTEFVSSSPEETEALGNTLAHKLKIGSVIALYGGLGAGKTCLVKGIARGLGITENITSPTYTIVNEYSSGNDDQAVTLYHIDAYRLSGDEDFESTGAGELIESGGIAVIEWSERIPRSVPSDAIAIHIDITGEHSRTIRIEEMER